MIVASLRWRKPTAFVNISLSYADLCVGVSFAAEPLIFGRDVEANAGIADQIPADEVRVAAVKRIAKRALQRVRAHHVEEWPPSCR